MNVQILEQAFIGSVKDFNNQYGSLSSMMSAHHAPPPNFASRMYYREVVITIEPNDFGYWENWVNIPSFDKYRYNFGNGQNSLNFGTKLHELIRNNLRNGDNLTIHVSRLNTGGNAIAFPLKYRKDDGSAALETFDFREYNISDFKFINDNTKSMYTFDHYKRAGFRYGYFVDNDSFKRLLYGDLPFKLNNTNNTTIRI